MTRIWSYPRRREVSRVLDLLRRLRDSQRGRRKVVFYLNHPVALDHFFPIFQYLDPHSYSVMFRENSEGFPDNYRSFLGVKLHPDVEVIDLTEAARARHAWRVGVSIIPLEKKSFEFLLVRVKLEHGVYDCRGDSYGPANRAYDAILCHGPYSASRLKRGWGLRTFQIGYPKYSSISKNSSSSGYEFRRVLGVRDDQILATWLPTLDEENSIGRFCEELRDLPDKIFLVAQIHPLTVLRQPDQVVAMVESGITILEDYADFNLPDILLGSDVTLHDFGGVGQAAIFLRSNPLFLNFPDHLLRANGNLIPEALVRAAVGGVGRGMVFQAIVEAAAEPEVEFQRRQKLDGLRSLFFSGNDGADAEHASEAVQYLANRPILAVLLDRSQISRSFRRLVARFARPLR